MMIQVGEAKTEGKVWELIRKERKGRIKINEEVKMEDWKEYFMKLLGGVERKVRRGERRREDQEEKDLDMEGIRKAIKKLKDRKAMGGDDIPNVTWKYGGEKVEKWTWKNM